MIEEPGFTGTDIATGNRGVDRVDSLGLGQLEDFAASEGSLVVISTSTAPGVPPASVPSAPNVTRGRRCGKPTMVKMTSETAATSRGELASVAPFCPGVPGLGPAPVIYRRRGTPPPASVRTWTCP